MSGACTAARRRIAVQGIVQGVGFRPFVYRLAHELALVGSVCNEAVGVSIEIQGPGAALDDFVRRLHAELPPGARIQRADVAELEPRVDERAFVITSSREGQGRSVSIAPDRYLCAACLHEMNDPADRRYRYPFITCMHCGPRYTIAIELPYDRRRTTMAKFPLCDACRREYENPLDRRYHAEPIACPGCGPRVWLEQGADVPPETSGQPSESALCGERALGQARALLGAGKLLAVKGIGGFHLAVDARNRDAVTRLRQLKHRPRKPLALMVRDGETAESLVVLDTATRELLRSPAAPIVLAPRRAGGGLPDEIAPGLGDIGVMLPYSPLHRLLFEGPLDALVMTSGNPPSEPITTHNAEALTRLTADATVLHDRDIHVANDDSVLRAAPAGPIFIRRSRGYVPEPLDASVLPDRRVLALGAVLKVTLATLSRGQLIVGRHLGDLDNVRAEEAFRQEVERMLRFGQVEPEAVAVDRHPDLASTLHAEQAFRGARIERVQHHHAHLAAVLVEHGLAVDTTAVGIILDGFGQGLDDTIWGGEVLRGGYASFERTAHLRLVAQPGGDRAALEPRRMATSLLRDVGLAGAGHPSFDPRVAEICGSRALSPQTSSAGRLFDGAASLLGVAPELQDYEGEAAALLEALADPTHEDGYPLPLRGAELDTRALVSALVADDAPLPVRAARFHNGLADGLVRAALAAGPDLVVLGGGCMVNRMLLARLVRKLEGAGRRVLTARLLPPGDGGLSAGQAAVAACRLEQGAF